MSAAFDAARWMRDFTEASGSFAAMSGGRFAFLTLDIDGEALAKAIAAICGRPERPEAVRALVEPGTPIKPPG